jgi:dynein heavy chain 1
MNIPGVQKSLERLADLLNKIQKALGEYLERERSSFLRFYFVGDEDLLEIIGNRKDILRIMKHLKKMFAGTENPESNRYTAVTCTQRRQEKRMRRIT